MSTNSPTPIIYNGIDIVSIQRIADLLEEFSNSFADRSFTAMEQDYCDQQHYPPQHYAVRWAAKEAFLKVLGEVSPSVPTREIEIVRGSSGPHLSFGPSARNSLSSRLAEVGASVHDADHSVSLSHDRRSDTAVGQVTVIFTGNLHCNEGDQS